MMDERLKEKFILSLSPLTKAIGQTFGPSCEVVLHDLSNPNKSIVSIENGHVTGRIKGGPIIGGPTADIGLDFFLKGDPTISSVIGYETKTADDKTLKSTSIFFRDEHGIPFATLCINFDLTELLKVKKAIDSFSKLTTTETTMVNDETVSGNNPLIAVDNALNVESTLTQIINNSIEAINIPVHLMEKVHKLNAVRLMYKRGVFLVKGGVERAAQALEVTRFTIYNYLDELRNSGN